MGFHGCGSVVFRGLRVWWGLEFLKPSWGGEGEGRSAVLGCWRFKGLARRPYAAQKPEISIGVWASPKETVCQQAC